MPFGVGLVRALCLGLALVTAGWGAEGARPVRHPLPPTDSSPSTPPELITLSSGSLTFEGLAGTGQTYQQKVAIIILGVSGDSWTAFPLTDNGGAWLNASPRIGSDDTTITITAGVGNLKAGTYTGRILINIPSADNTPQIIRVTFAVRDPVPSVLRASATALTFEATAGTQSPPDQYLVITREGDLPLNWKITASTTSGGNWLSVTPAAGKDGAVVAATAALGTLEPGVYSGALTITAEGAANGSLQLQVNFTVNRGVPVLQVSPSAVNLTVKPGALGPLSAQVTVANAGAGTLNWNVAVATLNGGSWLAVSPASGSGTGTLTVTADPSGLPGGVYLARVSVSAEGAANSPAQLQVTLTVERQRPQFTRQGIVNAASLATGPVAPGQLLSIFGSRLGPPQGVTFRFDSVSGRIPTSLGGVRISFDGVLAPLLFASYGQVNLQAPFEVAGKRAVRLRVEVDGLDPAEADLEIGDAAPGIFTVDGRYAAALNQDDTLNSPQQPAARGSVVQLFLTGQGLITPRVETGALAPGAPSDALPDQMVSVMINSLAAHVPYAGMAPGLAGLMQVNAEIPATVGASDSVLVVVRVGNASSPAALIAVR